MNFDIYNICTSTPGHSAADSMPLGGCSGGYNVWIEETEKHAAAANQHISETHYNALCIFLSESGAFDENNTLLKSSLIKLLIPKEIFKSGFIQELHLKDGYISINIGGDKLRFVLWADITKPELHIDYASEQEISLSLLYDCWRYRDRIVEEDERHQCRDLEGFPYKIYTTHDEVFPVNGELIYFHRNPEKNALRELLIHQQHCESIEYSIPDPLSSLTSGALVSCPDFEYSGKTVSNIYGTDCMEYEFDSKPIKKGSIVITLHSDKADTIEAWIKDVREKAAIKTEHTAVKKWWNEYFDKSYIYAEKNSELFEVCRNYQLFRYMLGCNYYGKYPTKFNGGLFTICDHKTPDFRMWGGGIFTAQNQRLMYWPMLKSGDFEAMLPQFEYYRRLTPAAKAKTGLFFSHCGGYYNEQGNSMGLCCGTDYNWHRRQNADPSDADSPWIRLHYSTALEFSLMILEYNRYSGRDISDYIEFIESTVEFYINHYGTDDSGKLLIFPSSALESYKKDPYALGPEKYGCTDPCDAISGLVAVTEALVRYYSNDPPIRDKYRKYLEMYPEIPNNGEMFLPAKSFDPQPFNGELPQLYRVFPFSPYGLSDEEQRLGINTYNEKHLLPEQDLGFGWHQNGIFAARLGLIDEAYKHLHIKLDNSGRLFPAFWGPGHDWTPDHDQGGSGMILLQEMLIQEQNGKIIFLPAWNKKYDIEFRLFLPDKRIAECIFKNGDFIKKEILTY